jgi:hypothetical protein
MCFDGRSSLYYWGMELLECYSTTPRRKTHMIDIPAGDGQQDAMRGLAAPVYEMRTLTAKFKVPQYRFDDLITQLNAELAGREVPIIPPNDHSHYFLGEVRIRGGGAASGEIVVEATVMPWKYSSRETVCIVSASALPVSYTWYNGGTRSVVPELTVENSAVTVSIDDYTTTIHAGIHDLSELEIPARGEITVTVMGGSMTARYREAIL